MFRIFTISIVFGTLVPVMIGCGKKEGTTEPELKKPVEDIVCGMKIRGDRALRVEYEGSTYYFCSEHCKESFIKEPERYLKKKDAEEVKDLVCGMRVDKEHALRVDYKGRTYYFCAQSCKDSFLKDPERYIERR